MRASLPVLGTFLAGGALLAVVIAAQPGASSAGTRDIALAPSGWVDATPASAPMSLTVFECAASECGPNAFMDHVREDRAALPALAEFRREIEASTGRRIAGHGPIQRVRLLEIGQSMAANGTPIQRARVAAELHNGRRAHFHLFRFASGGKLYTLSSGSADDETARRNLRLFELPVMLAARADGVLAAR